MYNSVERFHTSVHHENWKQFFDVWSGLVWHQSHSTDSFLKQVATAVGLQCQHVQQLCPTLHTMEIIKYEQ